MTRGPIPRFDLYEELEVSRLASEEVIDAAYRTLVKRYHPDVAGTNTASGSSAGSSASPRTVDVDRIKRLNVAHDWLTTPAKRSRYDDSTAWEPRAVPATTPGHEPAQAVRESQGVRESQPASFGPNGAAVRQFLAYLRPLDQARGLEIGLAKASLDSTAYAEARGSALAASRRGRHDQWLLARDAATVIARGKLVESPLAREIATIVADAAGAIVVRDLISPADYRLLLAPWALPPASSAVTKPVDPRRPRLARAHALVVAGSAFRAGRRSVAVGVGGMAVLAVLAFALLGNQRPPLTAAAPTDNPTDAVAGLEVTAAPSAAPSPPAASGPGAASPQPSGSETVPTSLPGVPVQTFGPGPTPRVTLRPTLVPSPAASPTSSPVPTPVPTPDPTPVPTPVPTPDPTPVPTPVPTPDPTPVPTPVPTPSPTPAPMCTVVNLFNLWTWQAQSAWDNAGFSGTVTFSPPGTYRIKSQSLVAGTSVLCTSGITVHNT